MAVKENISGFIVFRRIAARALEKRNKTVNPSSRFKAPVSPSWLLHVERCLCLFCGSRVGQKLPCQISADVTGAITPQTKVLGCSFSPEWQGNIFVHSTTPKVQETQGADGGERERRGSRARLALQGLISGVAELTTCVWTSARTPDRASLTACWVPFPSIHIPPRSKRLTRNEHFSLFFSLW